MKVRAQLPLVDPDFRLVERQPEKLHAYARGLLQHLRRIRAGKKAEGYPIATIKAAVVWLIESYAEAKVAPAPEAALLVSEIVSPHRDASTLPVRRSSEAAYWAAIEFEASQPPDPDGKEPSTARRYAVAKYVLGLLRNKNAGRFPLLINTDEVFGTHRCEQAFVRSSFLKASVRSAHEN